MWGEEPRYNRQIIKMTGLKKTSDIMASESENITKDARVDQQDKRQDQSRRKERNKTGKNATKEWPIQIERMRRPYDMLRMLWKQTRRM